MGTSEIVFQGGGCRGEYETCGFMECLDVPENMDTEETAMERVNNLFAQQNSISRSLLYCFVPGI